MFSIHQCDYYGVRLSYSEGEGKSKFLFEFPEKYKDSVNLSLMRVAARTYDKQWRTWLSWKGVGITFHTESELGSFDVAIPKTPEALDSLLACLEVWKDTRRDEDETQ
jgi:hypothetical protein